MLPVVLAGLIGAVVGALRRPHGRHLATPVLVLPSVVVIGVALHFGVGLFDLPAETQLFAASVALLCGFAVVNLHLVGMGVLAIGLGCNFAAVVLHGAMPVRPSALVRAGVVPAEGLAGVDLGAGRRFERTDDLLPQLGDIIPVEWFGAVMSFGDLIALMGIAALAGELVRYSRRGGRWLLGDLFEHAATRPTGAPADPVTVDGEADGRGVDDSDTIDLTDGGSASGRERLPAQTVLEVGVDGESIRVLDVLEDAQELDRARHVVDAEDRVLR